MSVYNSYDEYHKSPFGAVKAGTVVTFRLRVPAAYAAAAPRLFIRTDGMEKPEEYRLRRTGTDPVTGEGLYAVRYTADKTGPWFYWFDLWQDYLKVWQGPMGEGVLSEAEGTPYQLTVYEKDFATPDWLKGGVLYQIFPDRFNEGHTDRLMPYADRVYRPDKEGEPFYWPTEQKGGYLNLDYYGGDFEGIRQKLDYLAGLGVTCIYLNPIFEAHSNHRYNTADYMKPDPLLGTEEEFVRLCERALAEDPTWVAPRRRDYGAASSWSRRAEEVHRILSAISL